MTPPQDPFSLFLKRFALFLLVILIGVSIYFVWTATGLVRQLDRTVESLSVDLAQVTKTASQISADISEMRDRLRNLESRAQDAVSFEEMEASLHELKLAASLIRANTGNLSVGAAEEIEVLMDRLLNSDYELLDWGKRFPIRYLHVRLYTKFKTFDGALSTTEDFIERVATQTMTGKPYTLIDKEGKEIPLADWMREELGRMRGE